MEEYPKSVPVGETSAPGISGNPQGQQRIDETLVGNNKGVEGGGVEGTVQPGQLPKPILQLHSPSTCSVPGPERALSHISFDPAVLRGTYYNWPCFV